MSNQVGLMGNITDSVVFLFFLEYRKYKKDVHFRNLFYFVLSEVVCLPWFRDLAIVGLFKTTFLNFIPFSNVL